MESIGFENIKPSGDLAFRAWLNLHRFERDDYSMASCTNTRKDHTMNLTEDFSILATGSTSMRFPTGCCSR
jgi:hypothetical protein